MVNLLSNPGFEDGARAWNGIADVTVAQGWLPVWVAHRENDPSWRNLRPVYSIASRSHEPGRVRQGNLSQKVSTDGGTHIGGLMQTLDTVPGQRLRLRAYGFAWSTDHSNTSISMDPGDARLKAGIDPTGGLNPFAPHVVWAVERAVYDRYDGGFLIELAATDTKATVFLLSRIESPRKHNQVFWDDIELTVIQEVSPGPESPANSEMMLVLSSQTRQLNYPVNIAITSEVSFNNLQVTVSGPVGGVGVTARGVQTGGKGFIWRYDFVPTKEGPYTVTAKATGVDPETATISILGVSTVTPVSPPSLDAPSRGKPRTQFKRVTLLMPPNADQDWINAVAQSGVLSREKWSLTFNPDDAGIGDLDDRSVIIINPTAWSQPLEPWYAEHYPGVKVRTLKVTSAEALRTSLVQFHV